MRTYSSRNDAIRQEIVEPIAAGDVTDALAEYDVESIAAAVLGTYADGYRVMVDEPAFWDAVARYARDGR